MERLFSPCTRLRDLLESQGIQDGFDEEFRGRLGLLQELNLDVATAELLSVERAFKYVDLYAVLENGNRNTVVWLTPHAVIMPVNGRWMYSLSLLDMSCWFEVHADGEKITAFARSPEYLLEICDVVLQLLAASVVQVAWLHGSTLPVWRI
jgi:hypothetical protein